MNLSLLPGRLIVVQDPPEDRTPGGILYPDVERIYAWTGTCLLHEPSDSWIFQGEKPLTGQRIVFSKWSVRDFQWNGTTLKVCREAAVLATLEEENV